MNPLLRKYRVIFQDIDGVVNSQESMVRNYNLGKHLRGLGDDRTDWPDPVYVERVNRIITATDAELVLSSTWRCEGWDKMQAYFKEWGFVKPIMAFTPKLNQLRGLEIKAWLEHTLRGRNTEQFVILDDDRDMGPLLPFLVKTDNKYGIQEEHVQVAIEILNRPKHWREYEDLQWVSMLAGKHVHES